MRRYALPLAILAFVVLTPLFLHDWQALEPLFTEPEPVPVSSKTGPAMGGGWDGKPTTSPCDDPPSTETLVGWYERDSRVQAILDGLQSRRP